MRKRISKPAWVTTLALAALLSTSAIAETEKQGLELLLKAEKEISITQANGDILTTYTSPDTVIPGDFIVYTVKYINHGPDEASDVVISNPISEHLEYQKGSAAKQGTIVKFSVNNGQDYNTPDNLFLTKNGEKVPATINDYTNIQWQLLSSVAPNDSGEIHYKVKLK